MDILSFGLDLKGFTESKKKTLQEFISLFDQLSKYDGLRLNPVMGEGLASFSKAVSDSTVALSKLDVSINKLNTAVSQLSLSTNSSTNSTNSNTSATNNNTAATNASIAAKTKAAEGATRLAAAENSKASAEVTSAKSAYELAKANLASANSSNRSRLTAVAQTAAQNLVNAAQRQSIAAANQSSAAQNQLAIAQQRVAQSSSLSVAQQSAASAAYTRAQISVERAAIATTQATTQLAIANQVYTTSTAAATASSGAFARTLTSGLSTLRTLAYILPGLGIAGIFNLAFTAIGEVTSSLHIMGDAVDDVAKREEAITNTLKEQVELYKSIISQLTDIGNLTQEGSLLTINKDLDVKEATGVQKGEILLDKVNIALKAYQDASSKINTGKTLVEYIDEANVLIERQIGLSKEIQNINKVLNSKDESTFGAKFKAIFGGGNPYDLVGKKVDGVNYANNDEKNKAVLEQRKAELELDKEYTKTRIKNLTDYINASANISVAQAELAKFNADQERKFIFETAKSIISVNIDKNKAILSDDRSTQEEKLKAIENIKLQEEALALAIKNNIKNNNSVPPLEKITADRDEVEANAKSKIKSEEDTNKVLIEFFQRYIKARASIRKSDLNEEAIIQEKIYNNVQNSLDKRLLAYSKYVFLKQEIQDIENRVDLQKGAVQPFGRTSLTSQEETDIQKRTNEQKSNIQADAEKKIFDIVSTSLDAQLKYVKDINSLDFNENKQAYLNDLKLLNANISAKKIALEDYNKERKAIDDKNRILVLDDEIRQGEEDLKRLEDLRRKEYTLKIGDDYDLKKAQGRFILANLFGTPSFNTNLKLKKDINTGKGKTDADAAAITKVDNEIDEVQKKLLDNKIKREQLSVDNEKNNNNKRLKEIARYANAFKVLEDAILDAVKKYGDAVYAQRLKNLELQKQTIEEGLNAELDSIERSSLSLKDKQALEIQLTAEKQANEKNAAVEERKIKREQAQFDKAIAIVKIITATGVAVINELATKGIPAGLLTAAVAAAAGAVEVAAIAATPIPYKYGTPEEGHPGGKARFAESGIPEYIKEPGKQGYWARTETVKYLPKGTHVIPIAAFPNFKDGKSEDESWEQTKYLAGQIKKSNSKIVNVFKPRIYVDTSFIAYKSKILGR